MRYFIDFLLKNNFLIQFFNHQNVSIFKYVLQKKKTRSTVFNLSFFHHPVVILNFWRCKMISIFEPPNRKTFELDNTYIRNIDQDMITGM